MLKDIKMDDLQKLKRSVLWKEYLKPLFKYRAAERKELNIVYGSKEVMIKQIEMYRDLPKLTNFSQYNAATAHLRKAGVLKGGRKMTMKQVQSKSSMMTSILQTKERKFANT